MLIAFAAAGCAARPTEALLIAVEPSPVSAGVVATLTLTGEDFGLRVKANLDDPSRSEIVGNYAAYATLAGGGEVELLDVRRIDAQRIEATLPAEVPPGRHAVRLVDPWKRIVPGEAPLEVVGKSDTPPRPCAADPECDDGQACTVDQCVAAGCVNVLATGHCLIAGVCVTAGPNPSQACLSCDPASSTSEWTPAPAGTACDDLDSCTPTTTCDGAGVCSGASTCGPAYVTACFTVSPASGTPSTTFQFNAGCSRASDGGELEFAFDYKGDGVFTSYSAQSIGSHRYGTSGVFDAWVAVRRKLDPTGPTDRFRRMVVVSLNSDIVTVTTAADEQDTGATPSQPGGSGFSLREAILWVNQTALPFTITFADAYKIQAKNAMPDLTSGGAQIVGFPGVVLDFSSAGGGTDCVMLAGTDQRLIGIEVLNCPGIALRLNGVNLQVADCTLRSATGAGQAAADTGVGNVFGPGNRVKGYTAGYAFAVSGMDLVIRENRFEDGFGAIELQGITTQILLNDFHQLSSAAIYLPGGTLSSSITHNTFHALGGASVSSSGGGVSVQGNILTGAPCALVGLFSSGAIKSNMVDRAQTGCSVAAATRVGDPQYLNPVLGDLRLSATSPAVNSCDDLGVDLNGPPTTTRYNGTAPDFGAHESPY